LVEISLALAIIGIALVALIGLLPSGLNNFRVAMDAQTAGEIFQRVVADAQETDFDALVYPERLNPPQSALERGGTGAQFYRLPLRHFDSQGNEVKPVNPNAPTTAEAANIIYTVRVRGSMPGDPDPRNHTADFATSLPGSAGSRFNPRDLTFLTIQIAGTGGTRQLAPLVESESFLISPSLAAKVAMPVRTYAAVVARNGYRQP
jgi:uncharacterized protein (TIGR02598 family)